MKKYSLGYAILKTLVRIPYSLFYKKIKVIGKENIPTGKALIFAPNHQNALMDPLAMIFSTPQQIVFLARGDIFKGKTLKAILNFLKILPVYRQHDGKKQLQKNEKVFNTSVDYLKNSGAFCLFPEGIHNPHRNLRTLKKGIPRIAFMALEKTNFQLDVQIVPTGIYYQNKNNSNSYLQIQYGKALSVDQYITQIKENEQKAMSQLSKDMTAPIQSLIIDIPGNENYDTIEAIRACYSDVLMQRFDIKCNHQNRFVMDQALIKALEDKTIQDTLTTDIKQWSEQIVERKWSLETVLKDASLSRILLMLLILVASLPLAISGFIINFLPFRLSKYLRTRLIKDPQFTSSIKFVVGGIIMPIYFILISLISLIFIDALSALKILVSLPILSYLGYFYLKQLELFIKKVSFRFSNERKPVLALKSKIHAQLDTLFEAIENPF